MVVAEPRHSHPMALERHLRDAWGNHSIAGENEVAVVDADTGQWHAARRCASPSLYFFVVGHYRTFAWTHPFLANVATSSAGACSYVMAVMPDEIDASAEVYTPGAAGRVDHAGLRRAYGDARVDTISSRLRRASRTTFARNGAPPFAFAVVHRRGLVNMYPACLYLYWHAIWALAEWSTKHHGIVVDHSAVVIRTRPDVLLTVPLQLDPLRRYFASGLHGRHLVLGHHVQL